MRIGELSARTDIPRRMLRYYEEQELIASTRAANGYREYAEETVERVAQIRELLDVGLPTRIIREILPCLGVPRVIRFPAPTPEMVGSLREELDRVQTRIDILTRHRDAMACYLDSVMAHDSGHQPNICVQ
ncbi:MerR family transcriptional regulator [Actinokineospora enzanensis]|uniref:MerR family transcriptional regulator n=1 Tax=Actinokineospora enzanensis TaxID=155975 RepID=UPI0003643864|nr:MerR family transcriptional regulator [Actinokineospora enzanensis]